jgi:uncharacterized protein
VITWDEPKRRRNVRKHGFDFVDAEQVFEGVTYTYEDDRRIWRATVCQSGSSSRDRRVHRSTEEDDHIHIISMRKATKREREIYFDSITN